MAQSKVLDQLKEFDVKALLNSGSILSELEYQRAMMADRSLRMLSDDNPELKVTRKALRELIMRYENVQWSDTDTVTQEQITERDAAEELAFAELKFTRRRRELILGKIKELNLKQKDLATLLNHSKSYTSELLNGIRAFSSSDLILIYNLLKIDLEDLFITTLSAETQQKINAAIEKIASENKDAKTSQLALANK